MSKDKNQPETSAEQQAAVKQLMYVGPTLIQPILLTHRSVFNGRPAHLAKQAKELRDVLGPCFVPVNEAAAVLRELEGAREPGQATKNYKSAERVIRSLK